MAYYIEPTLWDDLEFIRLSAEARLLFLSMLCGPDRGRIPGIFRTTVVNLCETLALPYPSVEQAMTELEQRGKDRPEPLVIMDRTRRVIAIPKALVYSCSYSPNPNQIKGWWAAWQEIPACEQKIAHVPRLIPVCNMQSEAVRKTWLDTFGKVIATEFRGKTEYANFAAPLAEVVQLSEHRDARSRKSRDDIGPNPYLQAPRKPQTRSTDRDVIPD